MFRSFLKPEKLGHQHQIVLLCKPYKTEISIMHVYKMLYGY